MSISNQKGKSFDKEIQPVPFIPSTSNFPMLKDKVKRQGQAQDDRQKK